jgi:hypothetical protein
MYGKYSVTQQEREKIKVTDVAKIVKWSIIVGYKVREIQCKHGGLLKRKIMVTDVAKIVKWSIM